MIVAIQPDDYGPRDASSPIWTRLLEAAGCEVRNVDVTRADILRQLAGCDAFMWRHWHHPSSRQIARRLLPVVERQMGLVVYPDQRSCWHYDDKIAQAYLLEAAGIPTPETRVWFDREKAAEWADGATYPLVLKLWAGAASSNVRLVSSPLEARRWIDRLFGPGVESLSGEPPTIRERIGEARELLARGERNAPWELHKGYVLFQEFLPGNDFDTRVTVIGDRAFGFRRFNRKDDFRASGSGMIDHDPAAVSPDFIRLAFETARRIGSQSCAIDGLRRGGEAVVCEISYTYASWAVEACPGHWDARMNWHEGRMWPEEAQVQDLLEKLRARGESGRA
jgi:glutathione synthase/RimK-type ligase-like ATP-grasp enzyme